MIEVEELHFLPRLAIIVPCFNEANRLNVEYFKKLIEQSNDVLYVFIDDCSTDNTIKLLNTLKSFKASKVTVVANPNNLGKGESIRKGWLEIINKYPSIEFLGFIDADSAFALQDVNKIIKLSFSNDFDSVWSSRVKLAGREIRRSLYRHFIGRIIQTYLQFFYRFGIYDSQSGLKVWRKNQKFTLSIMDTFRTRWFFEVEMLIRVNNLGFEINVWEEPVLAWRDVPGSKIGITQIWEIIKSLILLNRLRNKSHRV